MAWRRGAADDAEHTAGGRKSRTAVRALRPCLNSVTSRARPKIEAHDSKDSGFLRGGQMTFQAQNYRCHDPSPSADELPWIPILVYHRVVREVTGPDPFGICVTVPQFEYQMSYLRRRGYQSVSLGDVECLLGANRRGLAPRRPIVITFDDGYIDTYTNAFPVLRMYGLDATVLLVSGRIGGTNLWDRGIAETTPLLGREEIREMADYGIKFGSHSVTHTRLPKLSSQEAQREIVDSKAALEDLLGTEVRTFGYPYGRSTPAIQEAVREAGYVAACGIDQPEHTLFNLTRVDVAPCRDSRLLWRLKVSGAYFRLKQSRNFRRIRSLIRRTYR